MKEMTLKDHINTIAELVGVKAYRLEGIDFEKEYELILAGESQLPSRVRLVIKSAVRGYRKVTSEQG